MNGLLKLTLGLVVVVTVLIAGGVAFGSRGTPAPPPSASTDRFDHSTLQRDAEMTQRMAVPGTPGPMERGGVRDQQLDHARESGFDQDLRAHQQQVDRMLAR